MSDVLINPWCTCVVAMAHGIHARNNSALCTRGTPTGFVNSRYLWGLTNNQTHFRTQPAKPKNWRVSVDVTTWFRGSRPHETVAGIQFVSVVTAQSSSQNSRKQDYQKIGLPGAWDG